MHYTNSTCQSITILLVLMSPVLIGKPQMNEELRRHHEERWSGNHWTPVLSDLEPLLYQLLTYSTGE